MANLNQINTDNINDNSHLLVMKKNSFMIVSSAIILILLLGYIVKANFMTEVDFADSGLKKVTQSNSYQAQLVDKSAINVNSGNVLTKNAGSVVPTSLNVSTKKNNRADIYTTQISKISVIEDASYSYSDDLVGRLYELNDSEDFVPEQRNDLIYSTLNELIAQGESAIPAIEEYLQSKNNVFFHQLMGRSRVLDEKSLRIGLFHVLGHIDGDEAIDILAGELQKTNQPLEITSLAKILENKLPGEFQVAILDAASRNYAQMTKGELPKTDAAPLFKVLSDYGDENTLATLTDEGNGDWNLYKTVAIANVDGGSGISILAEKLQKTRDISTQKVGYRMLAQEANTNSEAQEVLVNQARSNNIPDTVWPKLALVLAGNYQYQLLKPELNIPDTELNYNPFRSEVYGTNPNQTLYITDIKEMPPEEVDARLQVIEELLVDNDNRVAVNSLENARNKLEARMNW